ncbi:MAG TPA: biopolymer transporter ExbD [Prosthecobacter sp.]
MKRASNRQLPLYVNQVSVTALLDLVLLLLLCFVVAVPLLRREKAPAPPVSEAAGSTASKPAPGHVLTLKVQPDQTLWLEGKPVTGETLISSLRKRITEKPDAGVLVQMPSNFAAGSLARLMEEMHRMGVKHTAVEVIDKTKP